MSVTLTIDVGLGESPLVVNPAIVSKYIGALIQTKIICEMRICSKRFRKMKPATETEIVPIF